MEILIGFFAGVASVFIMKQIDERKIFWNGQKYGYKMGIKHSKVAEYEFREFENKIVADFKKDDKHISSQMDKV